MLALTAYTAYSQCAMCKAAAESDAANNPDSVAKGLNKGILLLLTIPYIVVGVIFRKELRQLIRNIGNKERTPFNKKNLGKMTFALTFITCAVILFAFFISFYKPIA
jgi:Na+/H+ antiporter NhaD/arsenite permease-like protein